MGRVSRKEKAGMTTGATLRRELPASLGHKIINNTHGLGFTHEQHNPIYCHSCNNRNCLNPDELRGKKACGKEKGLKQKRIREMRREIAEFYD
jgi:hypothetical protein